MKLPTCDLMLVQEHCSFYYRSVSGEDFPIGQEFYKKEVVQELLAQQPEPVNQQMLAALKGVMAVFEYHREPEKIEAADSARLAIAAADRQQLADWRPSDDLRLAAKDFYNSTVADQEVTLRCYSKEKRDKVIASGERLRSAITTAESAQAQQPQAVGAPDGWREELANCVGPINIALATIGMHSAVSSASAASDQCERALAWINSMLATATDSVPRLPDGWQMVPVEPDLSMIDAAQRLTGIYSEDFRHAYKAALSAAPKPEGGAA